jgi:hypothetical protein
MRNNRHNPDGDSWSGNGPHDKFLELCAISTSGDLTEEEQENLRAHLADCSECRQALKEFEAAADIGMPLLHAHLTSHDCSEETSIPIETAKVLGASTTVQATGRTKNEPIESRNGLSFSHRNSHRRMPVNWTYVWMPFAAAVVLMAASVIYSYQFGKHEGQEVAGTILQPPDTRLDGLEQRISDMGHEREVLKAQVVQRDGLIADLHRQLTEQLAVLTQVKSSQADLEHSLQSAQAETQEGTQEGSALSQKLDSLQASLQKTEIELDSLRKRRTQDQSLAESLEAQIGDLHGQLRDRELELGKQQDLLSHDRDIRELMGARDLYIAEVFDVARDGQTQKPYGRVFYTRGRSLIFYAYDLDQQAGYKNSSAFQAWGSHGLDRQQATSLGVFYEDNAAKKRWVLKFDDSKKLAQIDSVFVTVEPTGGSHKPSGKPLLFAYLKIEPNHP